MSFLQPIVISIFHLDNERLEFFLEFLTKKRAEKIDKWTLSI